MINLKIGGARLYTKEVLTMSRVIFADSEPHIRQLCLEELQDEGYEVQVAGRGREAVCLVESFQPDVVILEMLLPDISGLETGRMIKGSRKDTRVILYSFGLPPQDISAWGADDFVVKSPNLDRLKAVVRRLMPS
jgi:DNA-binding response OmpR family regulator